MKIILSILLILFAVPAYAQCVAEIKDVKQDEVRGSIIVETEYTLNGEVVQLGRTRYLETSGTEQEIIDKAKEDIAIHCENLIRRIEENRIFLPLCFFFRALFCLFIFSTKVLRSTVGLSLTESHFLYVL